MSGFISQLKSQLGFKKKHSPYVGRSIPRKEGPDKVTGRTQYIDDITFPGMIYGATVRSPVPRGRIKGIHFGGDIPWNEFTIVTAKDFKDSKLFPNEPENRVAIIIKDQPFLAEDVINHTEEPVVLLAHPDKYLLEEARRQVKLDIEPLTSVLSIEEALGEKLPPSGVKPVIWGEDNVIKEYRVEKGAAAEGESAWEAAWSKADYVVEGTYYTGAQEQLYIENHGVIGVADPKQGVTVWGSLQCPYYVHKALTSFFKLPEDKVRVVQMETGGGFGGKEDYPSVLAAHAALLAWKSGKPVKIIYDRAEDMAATTKRHPSRTKHRAAVSKDGKILALDVDFILDGGAYTTLSTVVLSRGTIHSCGPYKIPHVKVRARAVATNTPPHGAFRGFGAPQSLFAMERHMDRIAKTVGLTPEELRRRNFLHEGDMTATSQVIREKVDLEGMLERAMKKADFQGRRRRYAEQNRNSHIKRGIGLATFMHGGGFTGSGEKYLASVAAVEATVEGRVRVLMSNTEIGQGTKTVFSQIAADAIGIDPAMVDVVQPDTRIVPNSGPTVASRTVMIVGKLIENASIGLRSALVQSGSLPESEKHYSPEQFTKACADYIRKTGSLKVSSQYQQPPHINWDDQKYKGDAYGTFAWAVYIADVSVDTVTYETKIEDFVALQEIGKVVNPIFAEGQIEGGVAQAIGYALSENIVWKDGHMVNNQMTNYIMATAADLPRLRVYFEENPYPYGPQGAKGIGELPMDGPAPAIINAVENALGVSPDTIPLVPERLMTYFKK